ncbi:MAG: hypothetical protein H8D78_07335 [Chloroflexi bacterium]|nr:hypothetical protein [Chloroflexota bacterium]
MTLHVGPYVLVVRIRVSKSRIVRMWLGIVPVKALIAPVHGITVALDEASGKVEVFPDSQSDAIVKLDSAGDLGERRAVPDDHKRGMPN